MQRASAPTLTAEPDPGFQAIESAALRVKSMNNDVKERASAASAVEFSPKLELRRCLLALDIEAPLTGLQRYRACNVFAQEVHTSHGARNESWFWA